MLPYIALGDRFLLDAWQLMVSVGIASGGLVAFLALRRRMGQVKALLLVVSMAVAAAFGAHLAHGLFHPGPARWDPHRLFLFWRNGHSLIGAPAFCFLLLFLISRTVPGVSFWPSADAFSLGAPLGLFFARIGCYMKGCCWGTPIDEGHLFYGVSVKLVRNTLVTLHPVQLYSAAASLAIFCLLLGLHTRRRTPGVLTACLLLLYAPARFFLEFYRGDTRALWANLTLHQWICILLVPTGTFLLCLLVRKARREGSGVRDQGSGHG